MSDVVARPVLSRRDRKQFLDYPWTLYRDDPHWIPPLRINEKELVNFVAHPFYIRNEVQTFLAERQGRVCGRVAAILNHEHNERYRETRGFFGFFECDDDEQSSHALFDAARRWFAERGITQLRGPVNPSLNYTLGLLIEGFGTPPTFMMTYNPPYYERLVEAYGFRKVQDLYSFEGNLDMLPKLVAKLGPISDKIASYVNVSVRPLDVKRFTEEVESFLNIYNRSLTNTWGFVPMSQAEVREHGKALRYLIVPDLSVAAEVDGKMIGAVFGLLDYNPRVKQIKGRLFPFGFLRLLRNKREIKRIRVISANVLPEYQLSGVALVLMSGLLPRALDWGIEEAEFSWVLESNHLSRGSLEKGGAIRTKTHRLYDLDASLPSTQPPPA